MKLTVLGPGCWGLTLAWLLNDNFDEITIWGRESDLYEDLIVNKHCSKPLEVQLDSKVEITSDLKNALLEESDSCLQLCGKTCHNYFAASLLKRKPPLLATCFCWNN